MSDYATYKTSLGFTRWLRMNESSGLSLVDAAGASSWTLAPSSAGAWTGGTLSTAGLMAADADAAVAFAAASSGRATNTIALAASNVSIEGWFKCTDVTATQRIFAQQSTGTGTTAGNNFAIQVISSGVRAIVGGVTQVVGTSTPISSNTVYHFAATFDGSRLRFYLNGALTQNDAAATSIVTPSGPAAIGSNADAGSGFFGGTIDELAIRTGTGAVLTATEIANLYGYGAGTLTLGGVPYDGGEMTGGMVQMGGGLC